MSHNLEILETGADSPISYFLKEIRRLSGMIRLLLHEKGILKS